MYRFANHTPYYLWRVLITTGLIAAGGASLAHAYAPEFAPQPQSVGKVTFLTGGIGEEERERVQAMGRDYNLSIVSAAASGAYVGDTQLTILDRQGRQLLSTDSGPLFYAQLPPGMYTVRAESQGQSRSQNITVVENRPAHIHFSWK